MSLIYSLSHRAPPSSLFLSSHIYLSCSKLALKLGWIRGHGMPIGMDFGWSGGWRWDMWGWQCIGGWLGGSMVAFFSFFLFVASARGRR